LWAYWGLARPTHSRHVCAIITITIIACGRITGIITPLNRLTGKNKAGLRQKPVYVTGFCR
jgi:hypothetical protein